MSIKTTLNVHETTLSHIKNICAISELNFNEAIVMLLRNSCADIHRMIKTGVTISYQARDHEKKWHTIHVRFREDETDYFKDMRNFLKQSDSLILAIAARKYMCAIIKGIVRRVKHDSYPHSNYILSYEMINGLAFWKICWGFPEKLEQHFRI